MDSRRVVSSLPLLPRELAPSTSRSGELAIAAGLLSAASSPAQLYPRIHPQSNPASEPASELDLASPQSTISPALPAPGPHGAFACRASWVHWASRGEPDERRVEALAKFDKCVGQGGGNLDLQGLGLRDLPCLFPRVRAAFLFDNQLAELPPLPEDIQSLYIGKNALGCLPSRLPAKLRKLSVWGNPLAGLPQRLPDALTWLDAGGCQMTGLPRKLPSRLQQLILSDNKLRELPDPLPWPAGCVVDLSGNPLSRQAHTLLQQQDALLQEQGVLVSRIKRDPPDQPGMVLQRQRDKGAIRNYRAQIAQMPGTQAFVQLQEQVSMLGRVTPDATIFILESMLGKSALAPMAERIARDAVAGDEEQLHVAWRDIMRLAFSQGVASGKFDQDLGVVFGLGRRLFRLEKIAFIAGQLKAGTGTDEPEWKIRASLEDLLATLVDLDDKLLQPAVRRVLPICKQNLLAADDHVKQAEIDEFAAWMARWQPWQQVVARCDPVRYSMACARRALLEAQEAVSPSKVNRQAQTLAIDMELTLACLAQRKQSHLLEPAWRKIL